MTPRQPKSTVPINLSMMEPYQNLHAIVLMSIKRTVPEYLQQYSLHWSAPNEVSERMKRMERQYERVLTDLANIEQRQSKSDDDGRNTSWRVYQLEEQHNSILNVDRHFYEFVSSVIACYQDVRPNEIKHDGLIVAFEGRPRHASIIDQAEKVFKQFRHPQMAFYHAEANGI